MHGTTILLNLLLAQGGALPKGEELKTTVPQKPPMAAKPGAARRVCTADLLAPPGGNGIFTKDGTTLFLLASGGPAQKLAKKGPEALKTKYTLYKITLKTRKAEPMLSLDHKGDAALVLYGDPLEGMSVVSFIGKGAPCFEGAGGVVSLSLTKKGMKAVQSTGAYVLAEAPRGFVMIDAKKMQVLEMDQLTYQTKMVRRVRDAERPLFFNPADRRLVVFHDDGKNRGLIDYAVDDEKKARRLAMKEGDRVAQSGERFAAARLDLKKNVIEISELPEWTGLEKPGTYRLTLPPAYPVATAGVDLNFSKREALVFGGSYLAKQQWQRVFIFDYTRTDPVAVMPTSGKAYVNFAAIDPTGAYAAVEVRDQDSRATLGLRLFDFASRKFEDVKLPAPPKEAKVD